MLRRWVLIALISGLLAAVVRLQMIRDGSPGLPAVRSDQTLYLRSPEVVRRLALSYDALAADLYWIRAIQHYGGTKLSTAPDKSYAQLYPLLDLTTSLDPRFNIAYRFGAIFLSEPFPNGPGRPDLAIALLRKGLAAQPERWEFAQDIGFVYYWALADYKQAVEWFTRAADIPGAAAWLKPLAAVTLAQGGSRASSRRLWHEILDNADHDWLRAQAEIRLRQFDAMDHLDMLQAAAADFERRFGMWPRSWQDMISAGYIVRIPVDPAGYYYLLDPVTRTMILGRQSPLNPLPVEPLVRHQVPGVR
jgi:tetratricopeptide (TPR) repeat protein